MKHPYFTFISAAFVLLFKNPGSFVSLRIQNFHEVWLRLYLAGSELRRFDWLLLAFLKLFIVWKLLHFLGGLDISQKWFLVGLLLLVLIRKVLFLPDVVPCVDGLGPNHIFIEVRPCVQKRKNRIRHIPWVYFFKRSFAFRFRFSTFICWTSRGRILFGLYRYIWAALLNFWKRPNFVVRTEIIKTGPNAAVRSAFVRKLLQINMRALLVRIEFLRPLARSALRFLRFAPVLAFIHLFLFLRSLLWVLQVPQDLPFVLEDHKLRWVRVVLLQSSVVLLRIQIFKFNWKSFLIVRFPFLLSGRGVFDYLFLYLIILLWICFSF